MSGYHLPNHAAYVLVGAHFRSSNEGVFFCLCTRFASQALERCQFAILYNIF